MIVYAACDTRYFIEHGLEFINSCVSYENKCIVTVFKNFEEDPAKQTNDLYKFMEENRSKLHPKSSEYLMNIEFFGDMYDCTVINPKAYYASFRFLHLSKLMQTFKDEDFLVLDIDSLVISKLPEITADIGMYLRLDNNVGANDYEIMGMKVAAGIFYLKHGNLDIAEAIKEVLLKNPLNWFVDQHALYNLYKQVIEPSDMELLDFKGTKWLDWEFESDSFIWTAKGESRKKNPTYLEMKKVFNDNKSI